MFNSFHNAIDSRTVSDLLGLRTGRWSVASRLIRHGGEANIVRVARNGLREIVSAAWAAPFLIPARRLGTQPNWSRQAARCVVPTLSRGQNAAAAAVWFSVEAQLRFTLVTDALAEPLMLNRDDSSIWIAAPLARAVEILSARCGPIDQAATCEDLAKSIICYAGEPLPSPQGKG